MTVLAVQAKGETEWAYNPDADHKLAPGTTLVVLGAPDQVAKLREATG